MVKKLAILISDTGKGTNLQAIIDATEKKILDAKISIVVSDKKTSPGLKIAKGHGLKTKIVNKNSNFIKLFSKDYPSDYIVLAGWRLIIPDNLIDAFPEKILNIHPGLIPYKKISFCRNPDGTKALWNRGMLTNKAVSEFFKNKKTYGGSSVHYLSHEFDFGKVLGRTFEKINADDTIESFYQRLKMKENKLYIRILKKLCN